MPTLSARFPSFQLALLKPTLERAGIPAQCFSLFMYFGTHVGWRISEALAEVSPSMAGEWIWTRAAFGDSADQRDDEYFALYADGFEAICRQADCTMDQLRQIRDEAAPSFIEFCVNNVDWSRFGLIGFSVVFQQQLASLALAGALKRRYPDIPIILGGASMEDDIADEIMRTCQQVDFVHCGDGDLSFPEMVHRLYRGESMEGLRGVMWRDDGAVRNEGRAPNFSDMDRAPDPDFDEYFYARGQSRYNHWEGAQEVMLPIETARGCWWGAKHHCTFCGLNRAGMEFRAQSADRVIGQLESLSRRYGVLLFNAIDNIMAPEYANGIFERLARAHSDFQLHYEIRPNFTRAQLRRMRAGGLYSVQPGVESFSTRLLQLMKKFSTGMRNLELVKWCTFYGIVNLYNLLLGFAGESDEDYRLQTELMGKIHHFQPPYAIVKARADRGSPMFETPEAQSIRNLRPAACYRYIYPQDFRLDRISYYFESEMDNPAGQQAYEEILSAGAQWQQTWRAGVRPYLRYRKSWSAIRIEDGRGAAPGVITYRDGAASLYEHCADARSRKEIGAWAQASQNLSPADVDALLQDFLARDLMVSLDNRYLSLALPVNRDFDLDEAPRPVMPAAVPMLNVLQEGI